MTSVGLMLAIQDQGSITPPEQPELVLTADGKGLTVVGPLTSGLWVECIVVEALAASQNSLVLVGHSADPLGLPLGALGSSPLPQGTSYLGGKRIVYLRSGEELRFVLSTGPLLPNPTPSLMLEALPPPSPSPQGSSRYQLRLEDGGAGGDADFNDLVVAIGVCSDPSQQSDYQIGLPQLDATAGLLDFTSINAEGLKLELRVNTNSALINTLHFVKVEQQLSTGVLVVDGVTAADANFLATVRENLIAFSFSLGGEGKTGSAILELDSSDAGFYAPVLITGDGNLLTIGAMGGMDGLAHLKVLGQNNFAFEDLLLSQDSDFDYNDFSFLVHDAGSEIASSDYQYVIGGLFPHLNGAPNVVTSSSIHFDPSIQAYVGDKELGSLDVSLNITTDPVRVPGMSNYLTDWFIPQMTNNDPSSPSYQESLFYNYWQGVLGQYTKKTRANAIADLQAIGYFGLFADQGASTDPYFSSLGQKNDSLFSAISNLSNYDPASVWGDYANLQDNDLLSSNFDLASLRANLAALADSAAASPPLWYPSILYTYQVPGRETSMPGPVLLLQPGERLNIQFSNDIELGDLSLEELQQSTLVPISTYGNTASSGLGGATTTNFHLHGMHTNPAGFGDNVVARYTTGQSWTTLMDLSRKQAQGSYWYHPHYHPSVNGQLYGGLSGFLELGDTLGRIPYFRSTPRNLVELKNLQLGFLNGQVVLAGYDTGLPVNQMVMTTVNGEFQPSVDAGAGGWQSFSFSNQTNNMFYNIAFVNQGQALPIYIYGEDGQQLPQIRWSSQGALGSLGAIPNSSNPNNVVTIAYSQAEDLLALAPGKRLDVLVYLPAGSTEIDSFYSFDKPPASGSEAGVYNVLNMGTYPDLSSDNTLANSSDPDNLGLVGPGALATLHVAESVPPLSKQQQDAVILQANTGIQVQEVLPTTFAAEINPQAVQSINLFARDSLGVDVWRPVRNREFNWARGTLVGPQQDYDAATQQELARIEALPEFEAAHYKYKSYRPLPLQGLLNGLGTSSFLTAPTSWLGYDNPFLINDHVFPNGNLTIAQIGTVEQWTLANWSVAAVSRKSGNQSNQYIGHPFHIHINDFQVENSDTELGDKRNLEDVTMVNSSGYKYYNISPKAISGHDIGIVEQTPLKGELRAIEEAQDPSTVTELATYGANTQTVRMMFQDYLGTYVFHCHILPHEDAGMMQAVMVVENTNASWLVPAAGVVVRQSEGEQRFDVHLARDYSAYRVEFATDLEVNLVNFQAGDISLDYVQDLLVGSSGDGAVRVINGATLLNGETTQVLSSFVPYAGVTAAPWVFPEDFDGNGARDLVTGGFAPVAGVVRSAGTVNLHDFTIKGWQSPDQGRHWTEAFAFHPWEWIPHHDHADQPPTSTDHAHPGYGPVAPLTSALTGFCVGDFNLDNFPDYAMAYAIDGGLRIAILDGEALSLSLQTGAFEGGYDPSKALLADALLLDESLHSLRNVVLTNGFNSYGQIAIENLLVTAQTDQGTQLFTLALDAGHFIATSEPMSGSGMHHGMASDHPLDSDHVVNLDSTNYPLHLQAIDLLPEDVQAATPVFTGALANGALLAGDRLLVAQGNGANGTDSTSSELINTAQQLVIPLNTLNIVDEQDLVGITTSTPNSTFTPSQVEGRNNLANLIFTAYCGGITPPGVGAFWAAASLGQGETPSTLVEQFLADPITGPQVNAHFHGSLSSKSVASIVEITSATLYGRAATPTDLAQAEVAVAQGLSKEDLPLFLLQSTQGLDRHRVGLLSAYSQWSNAQWGMDASVVGSFGLGLQGDRSDFELLQTALDQVGEVSSWQEAQQLFHTLQAGSIALIGGTQISPSGYF